MNKKGFTLIELLAVIVILAIIAVIAIPRILNVVDESKKGAAESSALGYIDAVEKQNMINSVKETATIPDGTYDDIDEFNQTYNIQVKGLLPTAGSITITNGKVAEAAICISGYTVAYNGTKATVGAKCSNSTVTCYQPNEVIFSDGTPGPTSITPTCTGRYKLEVWGASGGDANSTYKGGYGGYSVGEIVLQKGVTVYINIGGAGSTNNTSTATGGANGGGSTYETRSETFEGSGGGATHIAYEPGDLSALGQFKGTLVNNEYYSSERIIIVAGGGGGGSYYTGGNYSGVGGQGGGKKGTQGTVLSGSYGGTGGTPGP